MIIGPYINSAAVLIGAIGGAMFARHVPESVRTSMPLTFGVCSMSIGVIMISQVAHMPAMILATLLGALAGELLWIERNLGKLGAKAKHVVDALVPAPAGLSHSEFLEKFVAILVLFSASGGGIFGAMIEGINGDATILITKSFLDLFTAAIFAIMLGYSVALISIAVLVVQLSLAYAASFIMPLTTEPMIADFKAVGGLIMLAAGMRISGIKNFPVANLLPALALAMPISALWVKLV